MLPVQKDGPHPVLGTLIPCNNAMGIIQGRKSCPPNISKAGLPPPSQETRTVLQLE